jgi:hypothetical protein
MPYLVIVWGRDKHQADQIVRRYSQGDAGRTIGKFWFPSQNQYCRCKNKGRVGWTRNKSNGLMQCPLCDMPPKHHYDKIGRNLFHTLGRNLIDHVPARFKSGYRGY